MWLARTPEAGCVAVWTPALSSSLKEWAAWVRFSYLSLLDCKCFSFSAIVFQIALQIMPDDSLGILETLHPL